MKFVVPNPFDSFSGAPIEFEYDDSVVINSEESMIDRLIIWCGEYYTMQTTQRVRFMEVSFPSPRMFGALQLLCYIGTVAKEKYGLKINPQHLLSHNASPAVIANDFTVLASTDDIVQYSKLREYDYEHPDSNGACWPKFSAEDAFRIVFGGKINDVYETVRMLKRG